MRLTPEIKKLIESKIISLATCSEEKPHIIYVAEARVKENKIILTDNYMNKTTSNIKTNPIVSLAFLSEEEKGFEIKGKAKYYSSGPFLDFVKSIPENKDFPCKGSIVIEIDLIRAMH